MTFIFTPKTKAKHEQTPHDIYFSSLEEAYGNLPVPSDDYADIEKLLGDKFHRYELQVAIDTIKQHYDDVAVALDKQQKYG